MMETLKMPLFTDTYETGMHQGVGQVGQLPPRFWRSEGAAGQRRRAALLPAPPRIFDPWCIPDYVLHLLFSSELRMQYIEDD